MSRRPRSMKPGQSLVEFSLMSLLFLAVLFFIIELGMVFVVYVGLTNSAREAARVGSIYQYSQDQVCEGQTPPKLDTSTTNAVTTAQKKVDDCRAEEMREALYNTLNPMIASTQVQMETPTYYPNPGNSVYRYGEKLKVRLTYNRRLIFLHPDIDDSKDITLAAESEMRIEPGGR